MDTDPLTALANRFHTGELTVVEYVTLVDAHCAQRFPRPAAEN